MAIEQTLIEIRDALTANTETMKILIAGREDALAQMKAEAAKNAATGAAEPTTRRTRAKKDDAPPPATTTETPVAPEQASTRRDINTSDDGIKALVAPWMGGITDAAARQAAADKLTEVLTHFASPKLTGPESTLDDEQRYQTYFFIERIIAGKPVNFSADYDFDADPLTQDQAAPDKNPADDFLG